MYSSFSVIIISLVYFAAAARPSGWKHVVHERRQIMPEGWNWHSRMPPGRVLPMRVALKQSRIEDLDEQLMKISSPGSEEFGKHWSYKKIVDTFAPRQETVEAVQTWLQAAGINADRFEKSRSMGWMHFNATVEEAETLLKTEYQLYEHQLTGQGHIACEAYHVPQ